MVNGELPFFFVSDAFSHLLEGSMVTAAAAQRDTMRHLLVDLRLERATVMIPVCVKRQLSGVERCVRECMCGCSSLRAD